MRKVLITPLLVLMMGCGCSGNPASPSAREWTAGDLQGTWTGSLAEVSVVPDSSLPSWPERLDTPEINRRYDIRNLDVSVSFVQDKCILLLQYRTDSLYFIYSLRGKWDLDGGQPESVRMDSVQISGRMETWEWITGWETPACCWQAGIELNAADPTNTGLGSRLLHLFDIGGRLNIDDLTLEKINP